VRNKWPWVLLSAGALTIGLSGCGGELPPPDRTQRRAVESPVFQGSGDSEVMQQGPHPFLVGELPEKKGQTVQVHTIFDPLIKPATSQPANPPEDRPAGQPASESAHQP
jgi:hypothetical protein